MSIKHVASDDLTLPKVTLMETWRFSRPQRGDFIRGVVGAAYSGASLPDAALLMADMTTTTTQNYVLGAIVKRSLFEHWQLAVIVADDGDGVRLMRWMVL